MRLTVKLFATFQRGRFAVDGREYEAAPTVGQVIDELGIPVPEIGVLIVNGRHVDEQRILQDGDTLAIFPVIGGG